MFLLAGGSYVLAGCPPLLRVESVLACLADNAGAVIVILGDVPALRADDLCLGFLFRISVLREDVAAKQRNRLPFGSANRLHPEKIQDRNQFSRGRVLRLVVAPDGGSGGALQMFKRLTKCALGNAGERLTHEECADGVDVAADDVCSQLEGFPKGRAAAHERIEHDFSLEVMAFVEGLPYSRALRAERAQRNRAKNRPEPRRPPFVDVVERPVDLFAPALMLRHLADFEEGEIMLKSGFMALFGQNEFCSERIHSSSISLTVSRMAARESMETGLGACDFRR